MIESAALFFIHTSHAAIFSRIRLVGMKSTAHANRKLLFDGNFFSPFLSLVRQHSRHWNVFQLTKVSCICMMFCSEWQWWLTMIYTAWWKGILANLMLLRCDFVDNGIHVMQVCRARRTAIRGKWWMFCTSRHECVMIKLRRVSWHLVHRIAYLHPCDDPSAIMSRHKHTIHPMLALLRSNNNY